MITPALVDRFLEGVTGQALREGTRYAREARVGDLVGSGEGVSTVVRGRTGDFETALWVEGGVLEHRCSCPSWRDPCKHRVAAALVLRQCLAKPAGLSGGRRPGRGGTPAQIVPDPGQPRRQALDERRLAARREKLRVSLDVAPFLRVASPSGFAYRIHLRGDADGPHSCDCPDLAGPAVFVSTDAGGLGLNLQAADVVVNLDLPWNPARLEQRIARVHRIGSKRTVQIVLLVCKDSIEERILRLHDTKRNVLENVWAKEGEDVIASPGGSGAFREMLKALLATRALGVEDEIAADETHPSATPPVAAEVPAPAALSPAAPAPAIPAPVVDPATLAAAVAAVAPALPPEHRNSLAVVFRALAEALEAGGSS